jgi:hypothetical protein
MNQQPINLALAAEDRAWQDFYDAPSGILKAAAKAVKASEIRLKLEANRYDLASLTPDERAALTLPLP